GGAEMLCLRRSRLLQSPAVRQNAGPAIESGFAANPVSLCASAPLRAPKNHRQFGSQVQNSNDSGPASGAAVRIGQNTANSAADPPSTASTSLRQPRRHKASSASASAASRKQLGSR